MNADQQFGCSERELAIIVDLDETLCTMFDVPVEAAVSVLRRIVQRERRLEFRLSTS